jgi:hypothetical protein
MAYALVLLPGTLERKAPNSIYANEDHPSKFYATTSLHECLAENICRPSFAHSEPTHSHTTSLATNKSVLGGYAAMGKDH